MAKEWYTLAEVAAYIAHPMFKEEEGTRIEIHRNEQTDNAPRLVSVEPCILQGVKNVKILVVAAYDQSAPMFDQKWRFPSSVLEVLADAHGTPKVEEVQEQPCNECDFQHTVPGQHCPQCGARTR